MCNPNCNDDKDDKKPESCQGPLVRGKNRFKEKQNRHLKDIEAVRDSAQVPKETIFEKPLEPILLRRADDQGRGPQVYYAIAPQELPILEKEFWITEAQAAKESAYLTHARYDVIRVLSNRRIYEAEEKHTTAGEKKPARL